MSTRSREAGIVLLLVLSASALALAPWALPPSYSWIRQTTSEAAAQGLTGAWVARSGFLLFGLAVLWLAASASRWGRFGSWLHGAFGVLMLATAAFSHAPWLPEVPSDPFEDLLHSASATLMGFAFALGVLSVGISRDAARGRDRLFDAVGIAGSVLIPIAMTQTADYTGLLQRTMFLIAYSWYAREALLQ